MLGEHGDPYQHELTAARDDGTVVLSDLADGTGAGSPGDATAVIAANEPREIHAVVAVKKDGGAADANGHCVSWTKRS